MDPPGAGPVSPGAGVPLAGASLLGGVALLFYCFRGDCDQPDEFLSPLDDIRHQYPQSKKQELIFLILISYRLIS